MFSDALIGFYEETDRDDLSGKNKRSFIYVTSTPDRRKGKYVDGHEFQIKRNHEIRNKYHQLPGDASLSYYKNGRTFIFKRYGSEFKRMFMQGKVLHYFLHGPDSVAPLKMTPRAEFRWCHP